MFVIGSKDVGRVDRNKEEMVAWELRKMVNDDEYHVFVRFLRFNQFC